MLIYEVYNGREKLVIKHYYTRTIEHPSITEVYSKKFKFKFNYRNLFKKKKSKLNFRFQQRSTYSSD